ncbi:hypothetical protein SprV_0902752800 [Sparganum proliferum]
MGSPISGLIAEAVLQKLERRLFEEYKPKFWVRYVDDTFVIIDQDKINYYAEVLNSIIPDLQITMEEEVGDKLQFLDVLVCRQPNGELATSVYRKPTNTLQMLSYDSNHPLQHKRSCVRTLYRRVEAHCSTPAAKLDEIKLLRELFRADGYPRAFIERRRRQPKKRNEEHNQPNSWRSIPYIKGVSESVARSLAPLGIGVAHRPDSTIRRQVMRPKTRSLSRRCRPLSTDFNAAAEGATTLGKPADGCKRECTGISWPCEVPTHPDDLDFAYNAVLSAAALEPTHLNDILPSPSKVGPVAHKQLRDFLALFPDLFTWSTDTIGRARLVPHTIDTGDARPIWQPPRRIPVRYRDEVDKLLDEMLCAKIIQPSSSP